MLNYLKKVKNIRIPFLSPLVVFFDLGTNNTRIAIAEKGIVLKEPTCLGYNTISKEYVFFGQEAKNIIGKTPEFLKIIKPLVNGIISDFDATVALVKKFIDRSVSPYLGRHKLIKPSITATTAFPLSATEIERKAAEEVLLKSGCNSVNMIEKPIVTALGCGIDIMSHQPTLIIDAGGGLIEISIISGGGIVVNKTLKSAGENMDKLISNYIYLKHGLILGESTCENLKINCLNFLNNEKTMLVRGKSLENGLPKSVRVKTSEIKEALLSSFSQIVEAVKEIIEISPPEIVDEIYKRGAFLVGGIANIDGLGSFFNNELRISFHVPENKTIAVIDGLIRSPKIITNK